MTNKSKKAVPAVVRHKDGSLCAKGSTVDGVQVRYWEWFRKDGTKFAFGAFRQRPTDRRMDRLRQAREGLQGHNDEAQADGALKASRARVFGIANGAFEGLDGRPAAAL